MKLDRPRAARTVSPRLGAGAPCEPSHPLRAVPHDLGKVALAVSPGSQRNHQHADTITWQAFAMTMINGLSITETAERLQRSEAVVYAARSRIMRRLRDAAQALKDEPDER